MRMVPQNIQELSESLARANKSGGGLDACDLTALNQVRSYSPEDMTVTAEAGMRLADLQDLLVRHGQWLPMDPPHADRWSLGDLVNQNPSGPRRNGHGILRDYVIGLEAVRADGQIIQSGGQVVKNVAGFDLCKLFIGAGGSLGVVTAVTFKLVPLPETEQIFCLELDSLDAFGDCLKEIRSLHRDVTPEVFDFCREPATNDQQSLPFGQLILGYAGHRKAVHQCAERLLQTGKPWRETLCWSRQEGAKHPPALQHDQRFWSEGTWKQGTLESLLPTRLPDWIASMPGEHAMVVRMGQGSAYHFGAPQVPLPKRARVLEERVKQTFDPNGILPALP